MQTNPHKAHSGFKRILFATKYSYQGLYAGLKHESALRQEMTLALLMLPAAFWIGTTWLEVSVLCITVVLVLITELLNSGIEAGVDRVSMEHHHLSKMAKDYGSAAVHLSLLLCLGVWVAAIVHRWGH